MRFSFHYVPLLLALLTTCSADPKPLADLPFSPRNPLVKTQITGRIKDYDPATDPKSITLLSKYWHKSAHDQQTYFIGPDGIFSFTLHENVIRDHQFKFNGDYLYFLLTPGENLEVNITEASSEPSGYIFNFVNNKLANESHQLYQKLADIMFNTDGPLFWETAQTMQEFDLLVQKKEAEILSITDSLFLDGGFDNPLLREAIRQFVVHEIRGVEVFAAIKFDRFQTDTNALKKTMASRLGRRLEDTGFYASDNINRIIDNRVVIGHLIRAEILALPKAERNLASMKRGLSFIDSLYTGLSRDVLNAYTISMHLNRPEGNLKAMLYIANQFIEETPFPILSQPIREQVLVLSAETTPKDKYQQAFLTLPENIDNPIPKILAQHHGKVVVLDFWATWCRPCRAEMISDYPELIKEYNDDEVAFVFLARNSEEKIWRDQISKLNFPAIHYLTDEEQDALLNTLFMINGIPHHTVFGKDGSPIDTDAPGPANGLGALIDQALAQ